MLPTDLRLITRDQQPGIAVPGVMGPAARLCSSALSSMPAVIQIVSCLARCHSSQTGRLLQGQCATKHKKETGQLSSLGSFINSWTVLASLWRQHAVCAQPQQVDLAQKQAPSYRRGQHKLV